MCAEHLMAGIKIEAENAKCSNCSVVSDSKYSGKKALRVTEENAKISFTFNAKEKAKYTVTVGGAGIGGAKNVNCSVNGSKCSFWLNEYGEVEVGSFFMDEGDNTVEITPSWTWYDIDYVMFEKSVNSVDFDIAAVPVDADATDAAKAMYRFLLDNFGKKTISGIMTGDMSSANGNVTQHADIKAVYNASGKYPALVGFDFSNATGKSEANSYNRSYIRASIDLAKDTYKRGGLPAFTWHWRDPSRGSDAFYTSDTNMKISSAMNSDGSWNTSSVLYKNIMKDIDVVADFFLEMQKAGVACIFRPLHEASGGWFWWGREGAKPFCKLYQLMYDEMVRVKGVHNVIWVWNAAPEDKDWNPGDDLYDVVSADIYNDSFDYSSNYAYFEKLKVLTGGKKIVALSENGPIPDIEKEVEEDAVWSWWMPWYQTWNGNFVNKTSKEEWKKCMGDSRVITLEDMAGVWDSYVSVPKIEAENSSVRIVFDLSGRRLNSVPERGVYIVNGKKYAK